MEAVRPLRPLGFSSIFISDVHPGFEGCPAQNHCRPGSHDLLSHPIHRYVRLRVPIPQRVTYRYLRWFHTPVVRTMVPTPAIKALIEGHGFQHVVLSHGIREIAATSGAARIRSGADRATRTCTRVHGNLTELPNVPQSAHIARILVTTIGERQMARGLRDDLADELRRASAAINYHRRLQPVAVFVGAHLSEPLTLTRVAQIACLEPRYFSRYFRSKTGMGFARWLTAVRIQEAARLLARSDQPVALVARAVGYANPATFTRAFSRCVSITPSTFVRECLRDRRDSTEAVGRNT